MLREGPEEIFERFLDEILDQVPKKTRKRKAVSAINDGSSEEENREADGLDEFLLDRLTSKK